MAYFPNGSSGECFDAQCAQCRFGESYCPVWGVQNYFNYEACNNPMARAILDELVHNDGTCAMFQMDPACFRSDASKQMALPLEGATPIEDAATAADSLIGRLISHNQRKSER